MFLEEVFLERDDMRSHNNFPCRLSMRNIRVSSKMNVILSKRIRDFDIRDFDIRDFDIRDFDIRDFDIRVIIIIYFIKT